MKLSKIVVISALALGSLGTAFAQAPSRSTTAPNGTGRAGAPLTATGPDAALITICSPDIQANCTDRQGVALRQCLTENRAKLAPACQAALSSAPARGR